MANKEDFQTLFDDAPCAVGISRSSKFSYVNPEFVRMFGYSSARELIGKSANLHLAPECRDQFRTFTKRLSKLNTEKKTLLSSEMAYPHFVGIRKDGFRFPTEIRIAQIENYRACFPVPVKQAVQTTPDSDAYQSLVTHDFANFSTTLLGIVDYLLYQEATPLSISQMTLLRRARRQCYEMQRLAQTARMIRSLTSAPHSAFKSTRIHSAISRAADTVRALHFDRPFSLVEECAENFLVPGSVWMDEILLNLFDNAINYAPEGMPTVVVRAKAFSETMIIEVVGGTAARDIAPHLFSPQFRGPRSHGSGLGLTLVKEIVESAGGTITADQELQHGREVLAMRIALPYAVATPSAVITENAAAAA